MFIPPGLVMSVYTKMNMNRLESHITELNSKMNALHSKQRAMKQRHNQVQNKNKEMSSTLQTMSEAAKYEQLKLCDMRHRFEQEKRHRLYTKDKLENIDERYKKSKKKLSSASKQCALWRKKATLLENLISVADSERHQLQFDKQSSYVREQMLIDLVEKSGEENDEMLRQMYDVIRSISDNIRNAEEEQEQEEEHTNIEGGVVGKLLVNDDEAIAADTNNADADEDEMRYFVQTQYHFMKDRIDSLKVCIAQMKGKESEFAEIISDKCKRIEQLKLQILEIRSSAQSQILNRCASTSSLTSCSSSVTTVPALLLSSAPDMDDNEDGDEDGDVESMTDLSDKAKYRRQLKDNMTLKARLLSMEEAVIERKVHHKKEITELRGLLDRELRVSETEKDSLKKEVDYYREKLSKIFHKYQKRGETSAQERLVTYMDSMRHEMNEICAENVTMATVTNSLRDIVRKHEQQSDKHRSLNQQIFQDLFEICQTMETVSGESILTTAEGLPISNSPTNEEAKLPQMLKSVKQKVLSVSHSMSSLISEQDIINRNADVDVEADAAVVANKNERSPTECRECGQEFNQMVWKFACSVCGEKFCTECIPVCKESKQRICGDCHISRAANT